MSCKAKICEKLLHLLGWTAVEPPVPEEHCIILGVPHTSIWDFFISYLYYTSVGGDAKCMVKKEMFFPPLGWILRAMGGIPVDRTSPTKLVRSIIEEMEKGGTFHLALAPEGTRKPTARWKAGFHLIARETGIPVYLGYFDWKTKRVGRGQKVELTDDPKADLLRIQQLYEEMHLTGKHPQNYRTH
ncbi:MAG: 1-acyl-sn-glycerol-3-phosphate acyltransferase [Bacteroidales bacterium]|nr:1-acyl-sn-glycerol-3-phosphate acyltransferase [Bacteroidales bacterium]